MDSIVLFSLFWSYFPLSVPKFSCKIFFSTVKKRVPIAIGIGRFFLPRKNSFYKKMFSTAIGAKTSPAKIEF
jgi:hypothetical protein